MRSRMRESASTDLREPQGSNPLGPPGPELNPEMLVALHRERLVSTLVDMAQSRIAPVFLPATHMGDGQPLHEGRQLAVALRPQKQVPVVRHHRVRTNPHR